MASASSSPSWFTSSTFAPIRDDKYFARRAKLIRPQVTDYLLKRGYTHTEAIFRKEVQNVDANGRPLKNNDEMGPKKYMRAFTHLDKWVENSLDLYKVAALVHHSSGLC